ncbi:MULTISPECIES: virulence factor BrkB family protein [unclassified Agarivorans]|uniref:virulence factor BrkB family protein n=1 Tax=unclassified Agarivorans TaxID=2636026 RepID=UPI0026E3BCF7|nr:MULTISPECIES: virulence factor BrkB family protein [unclassified Agarivorans]MDO6685452.1 virulence factor BrkB family protein [Agarivorans sp. 3_MG-2023]MDO6715838.1 virulence factor BrkB family protein [Agarivorans sp. 2_MG-2023]
MSGRLKTLDWQGYFATAKSFSHFLIQRIKQEKLTMIAGSLAYVTLLSLVPLVAVTFSIISAFPVFAGFQIHIEDFVFSNFVPASGEVVKENLRGFVENASKMTAVGIAALAVVALMLISTIDKSLNMIWRVKVKRRWSSAFPMYWMILTLGPLLMGGSLALSSYIFSMQLFADETLLGIWNQLLRMVPLLFSIGAFCLLYLLVPNQSIRFKHGLTGAVVAALLFELGKRGFALYVASFPSYQVIYGALASIPILFVWVYVSWVVVLIGAEITAALGEFSQQQQQAQQIDSNIEESL